MALALGQVFLTRIRILRNLHSSALFLDWHACELSQTSDPDVLFPARARMPYQAHRHRTPLRTRDSLIRPGTIFGGDLAQCLKRTGIAGSMSAGAGAFGSCTPSRSLAESSYFRAQGTLALIVLLETYGSI